MRSNNAQYIMLECHRIGRRADVLNVNCNFCRSNQKCWNEFECIDVGLCCNASVE
jgi:hypothetical protein